ncbi:conserved hypothetical protein [Syntrophobacter sp. SbD1]|nr:conserved hypothetical protein [Syntrophobacter sp. SbD1]
MLGAKFPYFRRTFNHQSLLSLFVYQCCIGGLMMVLAGCSLNKATSNLTPGETTPPSSVLSAKAHMEQGNALFKNGSFEAAVSNLTEAARLYEKDGAAQEQCEALIKLAQAYHGIGEYHKALINLDRALALSKKIGAPARTAFILGSIGNVYIALGPAEQAYRYLNEGLTMAEQLGNSGVSAAIMNNLGNLLSSEKRYEEAAGAYSQSALLARETGDHGLAGIALTNEATALVHEERYGEVRDILDKAFVEINDLANSHDKAYALINIALGYQNLHPHLPGAGGHLLSLAEKTFMAAAAVSEKTDDPRAISYSLGYLGKLYEDEGRRQEALQLTQRAAGAAQRVSAPESLYRWEWQRGRILKADGQIDEAISAYRRASLTLASIRQEMSNCYGRAGTSFHEPAEPLFREFVDLLLLRAASAGGREENEPYLLEAREVLESLKATELRDYFRDDCVDAARSVVTKLDVVSRSAVVIYPVLLQDRTELLVSLPSGIKRYSTPVGAEAMKQEVNSFRRNLEKITTREFLPHAQKLYNWLIRPFEQDLELASADTLVFVPDGPLRSIPMAALHDGKQFLISKYAIAITPGLNLTDPRPIERKNLNILMLGLTQPVQGFPSLPYVSGELETIQELYKGKLLLDKDFILSGVEKSLRDEQFTIVHIASHGQFDNDVAKTFLLTFDNKLTMDGLNQYVGLLRFRKDPLDLLALSACETAAGDDRAALGLAGIAVKAGARSALGTLWHINDESSSMLVTEFYRQLQNPSVTRGAALRQAQLKLLNDWRYQHPAYWSPFILINNWL